MQCFSHILGKRAAGFPSRFWNPRRYVGAALTNREPDSGWWSYRTLESSWNLQYRHVGPFLQITKRYAHRRNGDIYAGEGLPRGSSDAVLKSCQLALEERKYKDVVSAFSAAADDESFTPAMYSFARHVIDEVGNVEGHFLPKYCHMVSRLLFILGLRRSTRFSERRISSLAQYLTDRVVEKFSRLIHTDDPVQSCSSAVWLLVGLSRLPGVNATAAVGAFGETCGQKIDLLPAAELGRLATALSHIRSAAHQHYQEDVARASERVVQDFTVSNLVSALTAFSYSSVQLTDSFLNSACEHVSRNLGHVSGKHLAQLCEVLLLHKHQSFGKTVLENFGEAILKWDVRDFTPVVRYLAFTGFLDDHLLTGLHAWTKEVDLARVHPRSIATLLGALTRAPAGEVRAQVAERLVNNIPNNVRPVDCVSILDSLRQLGELGERAARHQKNWLLATALSGKTQFNAKELCMLTWAALPQGLMRYPFLKQPEEISKVFKPATADSIASLCTALCHLRLQDQKLMISAIVETARQAKELGKSRPDVLVCVLHTMVVLRETIQSSLMTIATEAVAQQHSLSIGSHITLSWSLASLNVLDESELMSIMEATLSMAYDKVQSLTKEELLQLQELNWYYAVKSDRPPDALIEKEIDACFPSSRVKSALPLVADSLVEMQAAYPPDSCLLGVQLRDGPLVHAALLLNEDFAPCSWHTDDASVTDLDQTFARARGMQCVAVFVLGPEFWLRSPETGRQRHKLSGSMLLCNRILSESGWLVKSLNEESWLASGDKAAQLESWRLNMMLTADQSSAKKPRGRKPAQTLDIGASDLLGTEEVSGYGGATEEESTQSKPAKKPKRSRPVPKKRITW